jgi:pimeloyl-ACP methyl ester carboxylesterase
MSRGRKLVALAVATAVLSLPDAANAQVDFHSCRQIECARLSVPLDRTGHVPGSIPLYVEREKARRGPATGATLLLAGGPGQAATVAYSGLEKKPYGEFAKLTPSNDIVVFDGRGTGKSGLLRCPALERANLVDYGPAAAACAKRLGARRGFYRTTDSVEDIEAVRAALGVDKLTLIGVSYGTFLAQAYAARYPTHVGRVLLDSVLDVSGWDPFYLDTFAAAPRVIRAICRHACSGFTSDPVADVDRLVRRLAHKPLKGKVTQPNGRRKPSSLTRQELLITLVATDLDPISRAELPGAVISALHGDADPLLRVKHHAVESESGGSPRDFSSAEYAANTCEEIPFPWQRFSDPSTRYGAVTAATALIPESTFYPFDRATTEGNDEIRMCRRWPEASPAPYAAPAAGSLPDVPVLMLSGEVDLRTPLEEARHAAQDWPHAQVLMVPDTGHSTMTTDFADCSTTATRRFLRGQSVAASCRRGEPFLRALAPSPLRLSQLPRAEGVRGVRGRAVVAAELTLFDVSLEFIESLLSSNANTLEGAGLRGGTWELKLTGKSGSLRLRKVEYMPGIYVSGGLVHLGTKKEAIVLHLSGPRTPDGTLHMGTKTITGRLGGKKVHSRLTGGSGVARHAPGIDRDALIRKVLRARRQFSRIGPG